MKRSAKLAIMLLVAFAPAIAWAHPGPHVGDLDHLRLSDHPLVVAAALAWTGMVFSLFRDHLLRTHWTR